MKKSNILLAGGFLAVILLITTIHITLYAKYKSGDYTVYNEEDELMSTAMQAFPNILFVSVRNVSGATVKFSDVAQVEKGIENGVQYSQKGDTLMISAKDSSTRNDPDYPIVFTLPYQARLSVFNSALTFLPGKATSEINPVILLQKSSVHFSGESNVLQFGQVKIQASDNSAIMFRGNTAVNQLDVQLANSVFEFGDGKVGQLTIATDSLSHISLPAKHLVKATIRNNTTQ